MSGIIRTLKSILRQTPVFSLYKVNQQKKLYHAWIQADKPVPPPHYVKQQVIKEYAQRYNISIFIETGTYMGEMINSVRKVFDEIYSIELGMELFKQAKRRFDRFRHITIRQGDSGEVLKEILGQVKKPCLFWLDAHYSDGVTARGGEETPIQYELAHIFKHPMAHDSVILIDDARCFTGEGDYPSVKIIKDFALSAGFDVFEVKDDIIRIHKQAQ